MNDSTRDTDKPIDATVDAGVVAASDIEVDHAQLNESIAKFAGPGGDYYAAAFGRIHNARRGLPNTFNWFAAALGPLWAASRAVWGMFWGFLLLEMIAWVQIGRGWWGNPGASFFERADKQLERAATFSERADAARAAGDDPRRQSAGRAGCFPGEASVGVVRRR